MKANTKKSSEKFPKVSDIEKLFNKQTTVILSAVDEKLKRERLITDEKFVKMETRINQLDLKLDKVEIRINEKIDKLITTLDRFLKRLTDFEDEFAMMKLDINRLKKVIKDKLGVDL